MSLVALVVAASLAGIWTNEEQVYFAKEAGKAPPIWTAVAVKPAGAGWEAVPVDAFGKALGPARALSSAEIAPDGLRLAVDGVALEMRRARAWRCWAAIPKAAGSTGWWFGRDLTLHDQGGRVLASTDDAVPTQYVLRMRNVVWPKGPNQPSIVLYIDRPEEPGKAISYSWADPDAKRVGINLRTMQASCSLVG